MKKLLSYIAPIRVRKYTSQINGALEVSFINGKKRLDTPNTNYSYGGLQKILHTGLSLLGFDNSTRSILVLGLGGGSIVETIRGPFQSTAHIELVDIDPVIIEIAKKEFQIERFTDIHITEADASIFMRKSIVTFDLIIVDIFIIDMIPSKFTETIFLKSLTDHLTQGGKILYNTMIRSMPLKIRNNIVLRMGKSGLKVRVIENVGFYNDLILAEL